MRKKAFQVGFAIALVILSIVSSFCKNDFLGSIVYAVVIPSFILSIISSVSEISDNCKDHAQKVLSLAEENMKLADELYACKVDAYKIGKHELPYTEGYIPTDIAQEHAAKKFEYAKDILASHDVKLFFLRCQNVCYWITVVGYVLLILSLSLSYYAVKLLSAFDLNSITLWSLTLLYFTLELKSDICGAIFELLFKKYLKKHSKELDQDFNELKKVIEQGETV